MHVHDSCVPCAHSVVQLILSQKNPEIPNIQLLNTTDRLIHNYVFKYSLYFIFEDIDLSNNSFPGDVQP